MPISITIPEGLELQISLPKLVRRIGHKTAGLIRQRLQFGMGAKGALPTGDGTPLKDTGTLIRSIKFMPRGRSGGIIFATGTRADGKSNAKILGIQMSRKGGAFAAGLRRADPLGVSDALARAVEAEGNAEIRKQITAKETKLVSKRKRKR